MANLRKGRNWKAALSGLAVCGLAAATLSAAQAQNSQGGGSGAALQWPMGGQNLSNSRNQTRTTITPANVGSLTLQWQFKTGGDVTATPAVAYSSQLGVNVVYFPDFAGNFYAVNAKTGQQIWTQKVQSWTGVTGDYSRDDPVVYANSNGDADGNAGGATEIILGDQAGASATYTGGTLQGPGAYVMAVDAATGNLIWKTQVETYPGAIVTSSRLFTITWSMSASPASRKAQPPRPVIRAAFRAAAWSHSTRGRARSSGRPTWSPTSTA